MYSNSNLSSLPLFIWQNENHLCFKEIEEQNVLLIHLVMWCTIISDLKH